MGRGRIIAVLGTKGAPGATTVAIRLAAEFAARGVSTALVDLDPDGGDLVAFLGLDPRRNLFTLSHLAAAGGPSPELAEGEGQELAPGLFVLGGIPRREMAGDVPPAVVGDLLRLLRTRHGAVVLDVGRDPTEPLARVGLEAADTFLLVARADLVGAFNAQRVLAALEPRVRERARLVAGRLRRGESPRELAGVLALPLSATLSFNPREARRAAAAQRPMRGRCMRGIARLARELVQGVSPSEAEAPGLIGAGAIT